MHYLSSCSIVKNEDAYIMEFYRIHKSLGVEFFLFFDRSDKPLSETFKGYDDVKVIHFPEPNRHAQAWMEGVKYFKGISKWVQFIDIDEVVVPMRTNDIKIMLQDYESHASLGLNWHTFGSNGHEVEPNTSTYEAYTARSQSNTGINNHVQSIVQVEFAKPIPWNDPHHPILNDNCPQVNERHIQFNGPFNIPPTQDYGFIAHYYTRSREYWYKKMAKMRADTGTHHVDPSQYANTFNHHQSYMNEVQDNVVKNIWEKCK